MADRWMRRLALAVGLWLVYTANGREVGAGDTIPAILQPIGVARGDGLVLDRFEPLLRALDSRSSEPGRFPPYYATREDGRLLSRYSAMAVLVTLPLVLPQIAIVDRLRPGWDATPASLLRHARWMAKNASAALAALLGVLLLDVMRALGLGRVALPATLVAMLGSPLWAIAAQSPWQHGPAALALVAAIRLLLVDPRPVVLAAAGSALGVAIACRYSAALLAAPLVAWALRRRPDDARWLLPPIVVLGAAVVGYNLAVYGALLGGLSGIEAARLPLQGLTRSYGNVLAGGAGTLVSPSRGLLLFCPWVAAALLALPAVTARLPRGTLVPALLAGLAMHLVLFASYSAWWAGWCFGPRYWTEAIPSLAILYAFALDRARTRPGPARPALYAAGVLAIAVHALGAACYPSTWNAVPASVGTHHARLWDWRDSELTRELREGPHAREFPMFP